MVDENGITCNGDILILLIAKYLSSTNQLNNDVVVSTVMSNFGFKTAMEKNNFKNIETAVGDKYVAEAMLESCLLYTSPSPRDMRRSRMPSSA